MFSKTEFKAGKIHSIQYLKGSASPKRKRLFLNTGTRSMPSSYSSRRPRIYLPILSMMDHLSPPELLTMVTLQREPSRMWFVDMLLKLDTMYLEDSDGIVMVYQLNTKSIKSLRSRVRSKSMIWVSRSTMVTVETLS